MVSLVWATMVEVVMEWGSRGMFQAGSMSAGEVTEEHSMGVFSQMPMFLFKGFFAFYH
jgi:hypothetical protein